MSASADIMSTSRGVQYIRDIMSTSGGYYDLCGGYHEYIRGCSVYLGDTMSTSEEYYEYIGGGGGGGGCSVHHTVR